MRLRRAVLQNPAKSCVPPELLFHNNHPLLTHSESTLLQLLIPLHFNSRRINTYKKPAGGSPTSTPNVLQLVNPSLFTIPSEARNLIFHPSPRPTRPSPLASIPFRITFFAHPHRLTLSESYSCKITRGGGASDHEATGVGCHSQIAGSVPGTSRGTCKAGIPASG
jgi:hypothetical protein